MNETVSLNGVPLACTLSSGDLALRLESIAALGRRALRNSHQDGRTLHLTYDRTVQDELRALVDQERQCCAFLRFELTDSNDSVQLDITAPAEAGESASTLYLHFLGQEPAAGSACGSACGRAMEAACHADS